MKYWFLYVTKSYRSLQQKWERKSMYVKGRVLFRWGWSGLPSLNIVTRVGQLILEHWKIIVFKLIFLNQKVVFDTGTPSKMSPFSLRLIWMESQVERRSLCTFRVESFFVKADRDGVTSRTEVFMYIFELKSCFWYRNVFQNGVDSF